MHNNRILKLYIIDFSRLKTFALKYKLMHLTVSKCVNLLLSCFAICRTSLEWLDAREPMQKVIPFLVIIVITIAELELSD